jgi:hypothetical protein
MTQVTKEPDMFDRRRRAAAGCRTILRHAAVLALVCAVASVPAQAQRGPGGGGFRGGGGDFHGRDFGHFAPGELRAWRGGAWQHGWHDGRYAWWWVTGGFWYFYPVPIYPYPTYVPPAVIVQQPPPVPTGLPPAQFWYFCDNPQGYYPYVAACDTPWREVPATPQQSAPPPK